MLALWCRAHDDGSALVAFPELGLSAYTLRDLFLDRHVLDGCESTLAWLASESCALSPLAVVGVPVRFAGGLFNAAALIQSGRILGIVSKAYLPNYREFEERRWFRSGVEVSSGSLIELAGARIPFGMDLLFEADGVRDLVVGVEICEDSGYRCHPAPIRCRPAPRCA